MIIRATLTKCRPGRAWISHLWLALWVACPTDVVRADTFLFSGLGAVPNGPNGVFFSSAAAISADGSVVGGQTGYVAPFGEVGTQPFRWTRSEGMVGLGFGGVSDWVGVAEGVSGDGSVIVGTTRELPSPVHAVVWNGETTKTIDSGPGPPFIGANAVSDDGSVVAGTGLFVSCCEADVFLEAFRWTQDQGQIGIGHGDILQGDIVTRGLGISGDGNVIVGLDYRRIRRAFLWTLQGGKVLLGDESVLSRAEDASFDGSVIVGRMGDSEAFRWTLAEGMVGLGDLPGGGFFSIANAVSADGSVVVGSSESQSGEEAFIWDQGRGMRGLSGILSTGGIDLTGWTLSEAADVSADGRTIVGTGINPDGNTEAWIAHIPEPSGLVLTVLLVPVHFHWSRTQFQWEDA